MAAKAFSYIRTDTDEKGNQLHFVREFKHLELYLKQEHGISLNNDKSLHLKDAVMLTSLWNNHKFLFKNMKLSYSLHSYTNGEPDGN